MAVLITKLPTQISLMYQNIKITLQVLIHPSFLFSIVPQSPPHQLFEAFTDYFLSRAEVYETICAYCGFPFASLGNEDSEMSQPEDASCFLKKQCSLCNCFLMISLALYCVRQASDPNFAILRQASIFLLILNGQIVRIFLEILQSSIDDCWQVSLWRWSTLLFWLERSNRIISLLKHDWPISCLRNPTGKWPSGKIQKWGKSGRNIYLFNYQKQGIQWHRKTIAQSVNKPNIYNTWDHSTDSYINIHACLIHGLCRRLIIPRVDQTCA